MLPGQTKTLFAEGGGAAGNDAFTVLLLHFDSDYIDYSTGATGGKVRTFVRSNGVQRQNSGSKFGTGCLSVGSVDTGDLYCPANSTDFDFGAGDFTIEYWVYRQSDSLCEHISKRDGAVMGPWIVQCNNSGVLYFYGSTDNVNWDIASAVPMGTVPLNVWTHVAFVRSGTTIRSYINGIYNTTITTSAAFAVVSARLNIGGLGYAGHSNPSLFDEVRISKGIARWTVGFTPPVAAYGTDTFDKLLLHMDGTNASTTFTDASSASRGNATGLGNRQVSTAQKVFGTGSLLLDGTGDYLTYATHADWNMGTGAYSIDCWIRPNALGGVRRYIAGQGDTAGTGNSSWALCVDADSTIKFLVANTAGTTNAFTLTSTTIVADLTWYHVAVTRNGNVHTLFINGQPEASTTYTPTLFSSTTVMGIGSRGALTTSTWKGNIDEFRIGKGVARWPIGFTLPTVPYGPNPNRDTLLMLHFDDANGTIAPVDSSPWQRATWRGGAGTSRTYSPGGAIGAGVLRLNDGDAHHVDQSIDFDMMWNDFTIDWWENRDGDTYYGPTFTREHDGGNYSTILCGWNEGGVMKFYWSETGSAPWPANAPLAMGSIEYGVWTHWAVVRSGSTLYAFKNGVLQNTTGIVSIGPCVASQYLTFGYYFNASYTNRAYIDEFRFSKIARWTADFPLSTIPYDGDPVAYQLLWYITMDGPDGSNTYTDLSPYRRNAAAASAVIQSNAALFIPNTYIATDGDNPNLAFRGSDLTIETWIMPRRQAGGGNYRYFVHATGTSEGNAGGIFLGFDNVDFSIDLRVHVASAAVVLLRPPTKLVQYDWKHVAFVRSGNTWTAYVDGIAEATQEAAITIPDSAYGMHLGVIPGGSEWMDGYLNEVKVYKAAQYTANFTPPAKPAIPWGVQPATYISVTLDRSTVRAGVAFGISFQCYNASGTTVNHYGTIHMTSSDPYCSFSSNDFAMGDTGYITATMNNPANGVFTVTATSSFGGITGTSAGMTVTHGPASPQTIYLTAAGAVYSFTIPDDWTTNNSIEVIAGGAGAWGSIANNASYGGGGGGYGKSINYAFSPGQVVSYYIGPSAGWNSYGGDAWFASGGHVYCQGGQGNGGGGVYAANYAAYAGGAGGNPQLWGAGGGGGAAGPYGGGGPGGHGDPDATTACGGGGGGSGGGSAGGSAGPYYGGSGGNSYAWGGGGAGSNWFGANYGGAGVYGGGGGGTGGNNNYFGGAGTGGNGPEFQIDRGSGGGGGGSGGDTGIGGNGNWGANGGYWGGGGGGVGFWQSPGSPGSGGSGIQGLIIIKYQ